MSRLRPIIYRTVFFLASYLPILFPVIKWISTWPVVGSGDVLCLLSGIAQDIYHLLVLCLFLLPCVRIYLCRLETRMKRQIYNLSIDSAKLPRVPPSSCSVAARMTVVMYIDCHVANLRRRWAVVPSHGIRGISNSVRTFHVSAHDTQQKYPEHSITPRSPPDTPQTCTPRSPRANPPRPSPSSRA
jgi:hypothetical protein